MVEREVTSDLDFEARVCVCCAHRVEHVNELAISVVRQLQDHHRGMAVLGEPVTVRVRIAHGLRRSGRLDRGPDLVDEAPELRVVRGQPYRVDDHGLVDLVALGEAVADHLLGSHRLRVRSQARVRGERRPDQAADGQHRRDQDQPPRHDDSPRVDRRGAGQPFGDRRPVHGFRRDCVHTIHSGCPGR